MSPDAYSTPEGTGARRTCPPFYPLYDPNYTLTMSVHKALDIADTSTIILVSESVLQARLFT